MLSNRIKIIFVFLLGGIYSCKKKHTSLDYGMKGPHTWIGSKVSVVQDSLSFLVIDTTVFGPISADIKVLSSTQIEIWDDSTKSYGQPLIYTSEDGVLKTITFTRFYYHDYIEAYDTIIYNYVNKGLVWHTLSKGNGSIGMEKRFLHSL